MTTVAAPERTEQHVARNADASFELPHSTRTQRVLGYLAMALAAYVPVLLSYPGKVAADTKQYLYLDPGRLLSRAPSMWDPLTGAGTVTHQVIGYLFPMGPFYWLADVVGLPDWVAQRLWLGSILFAAGLGVLFLLRTFSLRGPGAVVAAVIYMFSPYSLNYSARISVILLAWAGMPWMVAVMARGLRRGGWRHAAIFALIVQAIGSVNATALLLAGLAPLLYLPFAIWVQRDVAFKRAAGVAARFGALTLIASLWWMSGLWAQGRVGIDILRYTETIQTVAKTSIAPEILRGLGHWFFYGTDKLGPWIESSSQYTTGIFIIAIGYTLATLGLLAGSLVRWKYRAYFGALLVVGVAVAVGAHPYDDPSPFGWFLQEFAANSKAGMALRSTNRALPLVVLALGVFVGVALTAWWNRSRSVRDVRLVGIAAVMLVLLAAINLPALHDGSFYGANLNRPEDIPGYWKNAISYVDGRGRDTRVLELPGSDFASYRWGNTVDPITPGLTDRPYLARELIPLGSLATADLLNAFDRRLQEGVLDATSVAPMARVFGAGDLVLRNDLQFERFNTPRPDLLWANFSPAPNDVTLLRTFGTTPAGDASKFPFRDEQAYFLGPNAPSGPPVAVFGVSNPRPIVSTATQSSPVLIAGDGEGLVDSAAVGLVNDGLVAYSATFARDPSMLRSMADNGGVLVVTDSNRKRARRWNSVRDNVGYTERADETPLVADSSDNRLPIFPDAGSASQTVAEQNGATVEASRYGNPVSLTPENRAALALDGNPRTAWEVGAFSEAVGEKIRVGLPNAITTDRISLTQKQLGPRDRVITAVDLRFDGGAPVRVDLGAASLDPAGQSIAIGNRTFRDLTIEIAATNVGRRADYSGVSSVGFAEIGIRPAGSTADVRVDEVIRMPEDLLQVTGAASQARPLVLLMTRARTLPVPPRTDEELQLVRAFTLPTGRAFGLGGVARLRTNGPEPVLDELLGVVPLARGGVQATSVDHLAGDVRTRASAAIDGDPTTAWTTPLSWSEDRWITVTTPAPVAFDRLDLQVVADGRHSVPTALEIETDRGTRFTIDVPPIEDGPEGTVRTVPVTFMPIDGSQIRVRVAAIRGVTSVEYNSESAIAAPVAIAELGIPGVQATETRPAVVDTGCRSDLLTIDDRPVAIRVRGATADAVRRGELDVEVCAPVELTSGRHVLRTVSGDVSGIDLDRIVLTSAPGGTAGTVRPYGRVDVQQPTTRAPQIRVTENGTTEVRATVDRADAPFWFVLGQSNNAGWTLTVNGKDLGSSTLVNGYANGWRIGASDRPLTLVATWTPQRVVNGALVASIVAVLACVAIIVFTFRRRVVALAAVPPPEFGLPWFAAVPPSRRVIALGVAVPALAAVVFISPLVGLVVGAAAAVMMLAPRVRWAIAVAPAALLAAAGAYIGFGQWRNRYPTVFEWPTFFERVHVVGWLAVALLGAGVWIEILRRANGRDGSDG